MPASTLYNRTGMHLGFFGTFDSLRLNHLQVEARLKQTSAKSNTTAVTAFTAVQRRFWVAGSFDLKKHELRARVGRMITEAGHRVYVSCDMSDTVWCRDRLFMFRADY